mgnify:CR=1 FL=1
MDKFRKYLACFMLVSFIITTAFSVAYSHPKDNMAIVIAKEGIIRETANFDGKIVQVLPIGTQLIVVDKDKNWYKISSRDQSIQGWIYKDLIVQDNNNKNRPYNRGRVAVSTALNLRSSPTTKSDIIGKLYNGMELEILGTSDQWYEVKLDNGTNGFVHSDYIKIVPNFPLGRILVNNSDIFEKDNPASQRKFSLSKNEKVYIKEYNKGWYNIITPDLKNGWIKSDRVGLQIDLSQPVSRSGTRRHIFSDIKEVASKYLGKPYRYATSGPNSFDCSGFTYYILNTYYSEYLAKKGIKLPRSSRAQATVGVYVNRSELQKGDLVFFNNGTSSTISHVGIYIGDKQFVHASSGRNMKVMISPLNYGTYNSRYSTARRL